MWILYIYADHERGQGGEYVWRNFECGCHTSTYTHLCLLWGEEGRGDVFVLVNAIVLCLSSLCEYIINKFCFVNVKFSCPRVIVSFKGFI